MSNNIIKTYLSAGKNTTPLNGKVPIKDNWTKLNLSEGELSKHSGNFGWVLGENDLVVDVDPRNGGDDSFKKLTKDLGIELEPTVMTASGGFHIYLKKTGDALGKKTKKKLSQYPGIDFLSEGAQCVIAGSKINGKYYTWHDELGGFEQNPSPAKLIEIISDDHKSSKSFESLMNKKNSSWTENQVLELLNKQDPSMGHDDWYKVGMALHNWDTERGIVLWEDWSKKGDNYQAGVTEAKWRSFKDNADGISLGTLVHMARGADYDTELNLVHELISKINVADEKALEFDIANEVRKMSVSNVNREKIITAYRSRYKQLTNNMIPKGKIREMLTFKNGAVARYNNEVPEWCKDWVYVNSIGQFVNLKKLKPCSTASFNMNCGKFLPTSESGSKPSAFKYVSDRGYIEIVEFTAYLPSIQDGICYIDDMRILNTFNRNSLPVEAREFTESGLEAINIIEKHILLLFSTEENAQIFKQWLAHQVQNSGLILGWVPLIQSIQGVGKSFLAELLRGVLGDSNVGVVTPTQVTGNFNGWAMGRIVNILEELKMVGHNRHTAANSMKMLITDKMIQINNKMVPQFTTYNTINYLCFTNFKDAVPVDKDDRRWWVNFVPISSLDELAEIVGESVNSYFNKLYSSLHNHLPELRKWLLEYPISDEFKNMRRAPMTNEKLSMINVEEQNMEFFIEVQDAIRESCDPYYDENVVSSSHLFGPCYYDRYGEFPSTRQRNAILNRLGYTQAPHPIKIDGQVLRIWTKKPMSNDEVRDYLNNKIEQEKKINFYDVTDDELDDL